MRAGVPTVMMFVQSLHGISHNKIEDTREDHLEQCVAAFDRLAEKTIAWIERRRTKRVKARREAWYMSRPWMRSGGREESSRAGTPMPLCRF
jgi:hypothetical protein